MASEIECPVCGIKGIDSDRENCPQCDSELTCFKVLDNLPSESPAAGRHLKWTAVGTIVCLALFFVTATVFLYLFYSLEDRMEGQEAEFKQAVSELNTEWSRWNRRIQNEIESLAVLPEPEPYDTAGDSVPDVSSAGAVGSSEPSAAPVKTPKPKQRLEFTVYTADDDDTLWELSEHFYGSGLYYPVLLEHNPRISIFDLKEGVRIKVLEDPSKARSIYKNIVIRKGASHFWEYTVEPGDTAGSIASRFYDDKKMAGRIFDFNPGVELSPGQKIQILLQ